MIEESRVALHIGRLALKVMQLEQANENLSRYNDTLRAKLDIIEGLKEGDAERPTTDTSMVSSTTSESSST